MTGFGRGAAASESKKFTVEVKSLNSKQLDFTMRTPSFLREIEAETRNRMAQMLERGKVELNVNVEFTNAESSATFNTAVLKNYKEQIESLSKALGIDTPSDWYATLLRLPDAMHTETTTLSEEDLNACRQAITAAADALMDFRRTEGRKLYDFFVKKIENISGLLKEIEPHETSRVAKIKTRLVEQLSQIDSIRYDQGRLEQELIFYIEKLDVSEEKQRLRSHLGYFLETLGQADVKSSEGGQGKKLGFIAQEMGREINTLGSKSNNAEMQKIVVNMKDELEQIKEQVLNVL